MSVARINEWKKARCWMEVEICGSVCGLYYALCFPTQIFQFCDFSPDGGANIWSQPEWFLWSFFREKVCVFLLPRRLMLRTLLNHCLSSAFKQEASKSQTRKRISRNHFISRDHQPLSEKQCPMPARRLMMGCFWFGLLQQNRQDLHALILC